MVEIIEPHGGTVFDPACGSGGMFVQSAQFIEDHRKHLVAKDGDASVFVSGQDKDSETVKLARMNLAVNGLRGDIHQGITYYEDHFDSFGKFDYVLANPPFNIDEVSLSAVDKAHASTNASCASCYPTSIRDDRRSISRDALTMKRTPKGKRQHNV
jgi:type I restriction enzyme M protein